MSTILFASIFTFSVFAKCEYDSVKLNEKEYEMVNLPDVEAVIRVYQEVWLHSGNNDIFQIIEQEEAEIKPHYWFKTKTEGVFDVTLNEDRTSVVSSFGVEKEPSEFFFEYALHPHKALGLFVGVKNVFCSRGTEGGWMIYYVTNKGDYVLYLSSKNETYLFTLDEYLKVCDAWIAYCIEHKDEYGGTISIEQVCDIKENSFYPNFIIVPIGTVIICLVLFVLWRKKAKKQTADS